MLARYLSRVVESYGGVLAPAAVVETLPLGELARLRRDEATTRMVAGGQTFYSRPDDRSTVSGYAVLNGLSGQPTTLLRTQTPRRLLEHGLLGARLLLAVTVVTGLVFGTLALFLVERLMLSRLGFLSRQVGRITRSGSLSQRIELLGADELSRLARDINGMLGSLEQTFAALRKSEARYALAAQGVNNGVWEWETGKGMRLSSRCAALLGLGDEATLIASEVWLELIHPDDRERVLGQLAAHLKAQTAHFESELRLRQPDAQYRWMLIRGVAVWDAAGNALEERTKRFRVRAVRMAGSLTDIMQRGMFDALTGLPNRRLLGTYLNFILSKSRSSGYGSAVLFLDLDRFKVINDSLGHKVGDLLLIEVAKRLQACIRGEDKVGRLGGDEFVVVLQDAPADELGSIIGRITETLSQPFVLSEQRISVGASIGVVTALDGCADADEVLEKADMAMYRAKELGVSYVLYSDLLYTKVTTRQRTETELRRALEDEHFYLVYQPVVALETGAVVSFEALLRWQHPERGLVSPEDFIPVAEESGLILPLGAWALGRLGAARGVLPVQPRRAPGAERQRQLVEQTADATLPSGLPRGGVSRVRPRAPPLKARDYRKCPDQK